ncbi:MAG: hypothetical protein V1701_03650 [Planctomycetota bacterium]
MARKGFYKELKPLNNSDCFKEVCDRLDRIEGLLKGFLNSGPTQSPMLPAKPQPKFTLPDGAKWTDVVVKMSDTFILVSFRGKVMKPFGNTQGKPHRFNFVEMGFNNKLCRDRLKPDRYWEILQRMAEHEGELTWRRAGFIKRQPLNADSDADYDGLEDDTKIAKATPDYIAKEISHTKQTIYGLRKRLKAFFGLADDPFYDYNEFGRYKTRFVLTRLGQEDQFSDTDTP